jgi:hypothetical protein
MSHLRTGAERRTDRVVHAEDRDRQVVRYDRPGKWYVEARGGYVAARRLSLSAAVAEARDCAACGGQVYLDRPGGRRFDALYRAQS